MNPSLSRRHQARVDRWASSRVRKPAPVEQLLPERVGLLGPNPNVTVALEPKCDEELRWKCYSMNCVDAADGRLLRFRGRGVQQRRNDGKTLLLTVVVLAGEVGEAILDD